MKRRILPVFFCLTQALALFPQGADPFFNRYNFTFVTESKGLPCNFVSDILKDSDGYVWVATHCGIGRYDGYEFLNCSAQTGPVRLKNDFVHQVCEDNFRRLWIASGGGIDILDLNSYSPVELSIPPDHPLRRLMNEDIRTICKDKQGHLWIAGNRELWCMEPDDAGNIRAYYGMKNTGASPVHAIVDLGWAVYAGIDNQVCRIEKQPGHRLKAVALSDSLVPFSEDWRISCMQADGDLLWIGSNRGLFRYSHTERSLKRYRYSTHRSGMLSQAYITDIGLTGRGRLIVSTLNGLNVYHRDTDTFSFIRRTSDRNGVSINCNAVNCLFTDGETIWSGTGTGGINLLTPKHLQTELWPGGAYAANIDAPTPVNAIDEDRDGNLWFGQAERGLIKWNRGSNLCTHHLFSPGDAASISNNTLNGILIDSDNYLWAYTWGVGINGLDLNIPNNRTFRRYTRENIPGLEDDFISSACEDTVNRGIWFGSTRGIYFYDKRKDTFTRILFDRSDNEFEAIRALLIDRKKRLWVGTTQGVFIVDLLSFAGSHNNFHYEYLKYKLNHPESMQPEKINSMLEDSNGDLWLGGDGSGLYRLTGDMGRRFVFRNYTTRHGLSGNTITGMAEDGRGNLWLTTNNGVSRLNIRSMTFCSYTQADELPATQFYMNGIHYSAKHDFIYLAAIDGLVIIHAGKEALLQALLPVHARVKLSSLLIGGNRVYPSGLASGISLHEKDNRFSVGFTTQDYGNSGRIRFAYRLKGYEEEWNETQPGNYTVQYTSVSPGSYTLQVRATDELGRWSDKVTEIEVGVTPYFYKSGWFCLLLVMAVSWGVFYSVKRKAPVYRERQIAFFTNITHKFRRNKYKKIFSASSNVEELHLQEKSRDKAFITNAVNLMKENYADSAYNLDRFVRDMRYSKTLVNRKMHDLTGQPIGRFMKNYRLNVAKKMIQESTGDINVSEIAYAVGFNDPKYFTKCFKEFFGYLPSSKLKK